MYVSSKHDGASLIIKAAALAAKYRKVKQCRLRGSARKRARRTVEEVYDCLGPLYFCRAYRMSYASFWKLHNKLASKIIDAFRQYRRYLRKGGRKGRKGGVFKPPPIPNGAISTSVRLALALRYFAGGSPYDLMVAYYGVSHSSVFDSVWIVVEAIKSERDFDIEYPSSHEEQRRIAHEFKKKSQVGFDNCVGAIDGILIWMHKPSEKECKRSKVDQKKYLCGRKHKFGLNCQAVCDVRGRFLDMSITYGGSSLDCLAFEDSNLYKRLEDGLLKPGYVLFGDNAYLNSFFMATPYPNVSGGDSNIEVSKDNYNFYHSQVRIRIECAFGMLVQRWGILRMAMPKNLSIKKIILLVNVLARLHNFCINELPIIDDHGISEDLNADTVNMMNNIDGYVTMDIVEGCEVGVPTALMHGGEHFQDFSRSKKKQHNRKHPDDRTPRSLLLHRVINSLMKRPVKVK